MEKEKIIDLLDKFKIPIALIFVGIVLILGGYFFSENSSKSKNSLSSYPKESIISNKNLTVDVSGAVISQGVYKIKEGGRVEDAILAAGGIATNSANQEYISKYLNLAQKISDGMKIYVPFEGETQVSVGGGGIVAGTSTNAQVNINTASQSELEALPGIGPVTAAKIIGSRPYQKIEDLLSQKIVSKSTFEKIKSSVIIY